MEVALHGLACLLDDKGWCSSLHTFAMVALKTEGLSSNMATGGHCRHGMVVTADGGGMHIVAQ